jgi:hypothetical protein
MKNKKFNKRLFGIRLFVWPLIFVLLLIPHLYYVVKRTYHFFRYGGEYVNFEQNERHTILEIFEMLKEIKENQKSQ